MVAQPFELVRGVRRYTCYICRTESLRVTSLRGGYAPPGWTYIWYREYKATTRVMVVCQRCTQDYLMMLRRPPRVGRPLPYYGVEPPEGRRHGKKSTRRRSD